MARERHGDGPSRAPDDPNEGPPDASSAAEMDQRAGSLPTGFEWSPAWEGALRAAAHDPGDDPIDPPESGASIGRFEIIREIGRGGQGVVYLARQPGTDRPVAVKRLRAGVVDDVAARRRFEREILAAARLDHPGIATVHAVEEADGAPLLVMGFVDGIPCTEWARRRPDRVIVELMVDLCHAVHHAHQRGVIHCDLKPSNVLVVDDGGRARATVLDFGLARLIGDAPDETSAPDASPTHPTDHRRFRGSPAWAAPEQLDGRLPPDVRTDVHAIATMLFVALTGAMPRPVHGRTQDVIDALARTPASDPRAIRPDLGEPLAAILRRSLARDPDDRYHSVAALADDLERFLAHRPVEAHPGRRWYPARCLMRRRWRSCLVAATLVLVAGAFVLQLDRARRAAESSQARSERATTFIADVLAAAGPRGLGASFELDELLRDAEARARDELASDPAVSARIFATLGDIRTARWEWMDADRCFAAAVEAATRSGPTSDDIRRAAHLGRGRALASQRLPEAVPWLESLLAEFGPSEGLTDHLRIVRARTRMRLAYAIVMTSDPTPRLDGAETPEADRPSTLIAQAHEDFAAASALDHRDRAACLHIEGFLALRRGDLEQADSCYAAAHEILRTRGDVADPHYGDLMYGWVHLLRMRGRHAALASIHDEALVVLRRAYAPARLAALYGMIARALEDVGRTDEAWPLRCQQLWAAADRRADEEALDAASTPGVTNEGSPAATDPLVTRGLSARGTRPRGSLDAVAARLDPDDPESAIVAANALLDRVESRSDPAAVRFELAQLALALGSHRLAAGDPAGATVVVRCATIEGPGTLLGAQARHRLAYAWLSEWRHGLNDDGPSATRQLLEPSVDPRRRFARRTSWRHASIEVLYGLALVADGEQERGELHLADAMPRLERSAGPDASAARLARAILDTHARPPGHRQPIRTAPTTAATPRPRRRRAR